MNEKNSSGNLPARQKLFCQYVAEGTNPSLAAIKAGYSPKGNRSRASRFTKRAEIQAEIRRLQGEIASPRIMTLQKRKERLSEIAKAKITDYFEVVNGGLQWKVNIEKAPPDGIFVMKTVTKTDKFGNVISTVSVKLGDPIKAIHELNKMDGLHKQLPQPNESDLNRQTPHTVDARKKLLDEINKVAERMKANNSPDNTC